MIGPFLAAIAGPIAKRVLGALGIGVVAFVGFDQAISGMLNQAAAAWSGMGADTAAYIALAGGHQALSIICGAITARVGLVVLKRLAVM